MALAQTTVAIGLATCRRRKSGRKMQARNPSQACRSAGQVSRVFEFFSGMGGLRAGYRLAMGADSKLPRWRAYEVDETCIHTYSELFGSQKVFGVRKTSRWEYASGPDEVWRCSIDKLPGAAFEGADVWLMSPPCQPFTRTGHRLDIKDTRCAPLLKLVDELPKLGSLPRAIFLENVPEFRGSKMHAKLKAGLRACDKARGVKYNVEEFVLNPTSFGFPNTRKRFYLIAYDASQNTAAHPEERIPLPGIDCDEVPVRPVGDFCTHRQPSVDDYRVPESLLKRAFQNSWQLDVATGKSGLTKTFTQAYGKKEKGYGEEGLSKAGPLLLTEDDGWTPSDQGRRRFGVLNQKDWDHVRYFAPEEILGIHGYPSEMKLPEWLKTRQQWRLIGNSVNVAVVGRVLERLLASI